MNRTAAIVGPCAVIACFVWFASWTGKDQPTAAPEALWILLTSGPLALAWLVAAIGVGWPARVLFARTHSQQLAMQIALGLAAMFMLDESLGALGLLQWGGSAIGWMLIIAGCLCAIVQFIRWLRQAHEFNPPAWPIWLAAPACATLLVAVTSAPGWLWATEFGGYDALSYHLQLAKEWQSLGRIVPLEHNVYSFLPGYVEAAYYHLAVIMGDGIASIYAAQLLHAMLTLITAWFAWRLAARLINPAMGSVAAAVFLGTPWITVVGSLAYNEMPTLLMLGAGLLATCDQRSSPRQRGLLVGVFSGAAIGVKLTSLGFVAAPLGLLLVVRESRRVQATLCALAGAAIVLTPYVLRNEFAAGNPFFPFATSFFGAAHWSPEQVSTWWHGHSRDLSMPQRFVEFWNQFLRFGLGSNPDPHEPWKPQWSILPWLAIAGLIAGLITKRTRSVAGRITLILVVQILFWLFFTHLKSRFMITASLPLTIAAIIGVDWFRTQCAWLVRRAMARFAGTVALAVWCMQPAILFFGEGNQSPAAAIGKVDVFTGDSLSEQDRQELGATAFPAVAVNYLLPADSKVLAIGYATPLYVRRPLVYHTTWDRGILSHLMREHPDQPDQWAIGLRSVGFTHLLIDETMLRIWEKSGWNDPLLTHDRIAQLARIAAQPLFNYPNGVSIDRLTGPAKSNAFSGEK